MITLREGFFKSDDEPDLPAPRARTKPWLGRRIFLDALSRVEGSKTVAKKNYKGASICRCCGEKNGSAEYRLQVGKEITVVWPCGLTHYVHEHNVRPGLMFQDLVLQVAKGLE